MSTDKLLKEFISLTDKQKKAVINKLNNDKNTPSELVSGLNWLYELSKSKTKKAMYNFIKE
jgi:hypothetical protein